MADGCGGSDCDELAIAGPVKAGMPARSAVRVGLCWVAVLTVATGMLDAPRTLLTCPMAAPMWAPAPSGVEGERSVILYINRCENMQNIDSRVMSGSYPPRLVGVHRRRFQICRHISQTGIQLEVRTHSACSRLGVLGILVACSPLLVSGVGGVKVGGRAKLLCV
jgi:hypothetical protein